MKLPWGFHLGVLLLCSNDWAMGGTADRQEVVLSATPGDSPGQISFVEENVTFSPHHDDRDYRRLYRAPIRVNEAVFGK
jgi:hypothetical protein